MRNRSVQAPSAVVLIRPHHFLPNWETASDNAFQCHSEITNPTEITERAYEEATRVASTLEDHGVRVHVFEDKSDRTPDSVFPNNWFSTHPGGHIAIYPMFAKSRRLERRADIIEMLKNEYRVQDVVDYSGLEPDGVFLEGTGAMVLDHFDRVAYAVKSRRADPIALERFCAHFNYEPMSFEAIDENGKAIYHTNVLMCIATAFAMIGLGHLRDEMRRGEVVSRIEASGRTVIDLSCDQIRRFAGNAIELQGPSGRILALSTVAYEALDTKQLDIIHNSTTPVALDIPTIEMAGGSVRCMLAGIHLAAR